MKPTVEIHLTVDGAVLYKQPKGVRVVFKNFETEPNEQLLALEEAEPNRTVKIKRGRYGKYIETVFS